jgi:ferric-dicitrate binding protein FerR (iron transport regulator)
VEKKYLLFTIEELLDDHQFVLWLRNQKENIGLERLVCEDSNFASKVRTARKLLLILNERNEELPKEDIYKIWKNIEKFDQKSKRILFYPSFKKLFRYAAMLILILGISGLIYYGYKQESNHPLYEFAKSEQTGNSKLILSSGKEIDLKKKESVLKVNSIDNAIKIDNDSVVNLTSQSKSSGSGMNEVIVPYGKRSIIELADGTKVWLNAGSRFAFPDNFKGNSRDVILEGEAYFDVTHNESLPFHVKTKDITVSVLGTRFNVSAYESDESVMTVLVEGKVALSENSRFNLMKKEIVMKPNQRTVFEKSTRAMTISEEADLSYYTAWTEGWLKFSKADISSVFQKMERFYNIAIIYDQNYLTGELVSGKLDLKESMSDVFKALGDVAMIDFRIDGNNIYITKKIELLPMKN